MESFAEGKLYAIRYEERSGYLYACVQGREDSMEVSMAYWAEIISCCRGKNISKLLVEEDFETDNTLFDTYELIISGTELKIHDIKIAFVDRHPDQTKTNLFGENVAHNVGLWGKCFSNVKEAEEWLLS